MKYWWKKLGKFSDLLLIYIYIKNTSVTEGLWHHWMGWVMSWSSTNEKPELTGTEKRKTLPNTQISAGPQGGVTATDHGFTGDFFLLPLSVNTHRLEMTLNGPQMWTLVGPCMWRSNWLMTRLGLTPRPPGSRRGSVPSFPSTHNRIKQSKMNKLRELYSSDSRHCIIGIHGVSAPQELFWNSPYADSNTSFVCSAVCKKHSLPRDDLQSMYN